VLRLLVKNFLHILESVLALDDGVLLLVGSHFGTKVLNDNLVWHSERVGHVFQIGHVGFDSIQSAFLLENHLRHSVSKR